MTLRQTIIIASICEFSGAMLLGSKVTATIKGSIVVGELYEDNPAELMFGMFTVLIGCAFWLVIATYYALPVSSTHTCIGGMLGMAIASKGPKAIHWGTVINVICSWFYTPLIAGIISFCLFWITRRMILKKDDSFERTLIVFSPLIAAVLFLNFFVLLNGGCPWIPTLSSWLAALISLALSLLIALILRFAAVPSIRRRAESVVAVSNEEPLIKEEVSVDVASSSPVATPATDPHTSPASSHSPLSLKFDEYDVFSTLKSDETVASIHERAEEFDPKTERVFVYLQVLSAVLNSFAHGANDVSHSIGPFAACIAIYQTGRIDDTSPCPAWILAFGALGIVLGLASMGYKVMATVGVNLVTVTPCRGFFIELAASLVVIVGSRLAMPLSTTQCKVGSTVGVGIVGGSESVNWKLFLKIFGGWIATIIIAALVSGLLMGYGIYAPHA